MKFLSMFPLISYGVFKLIFYDLCYVILVSDPVQCLQHPIQDSISKKNAKTERNVPQSREGNDLAMKYHFSWYMKKDGFVLF